MKKPLALLAGLLVLGALGYQASPIGGAKVSLLDESGRPLTNYGKVYYTIWTFGENGSIKILKKGTLTGSILKSLILQENVIKLNLDAPRGIAVKKGSNTAFIGVDVWVVKDGKIYTLPPESFELRSSEKNILAKNIELKFNLKEARIKDLRTLNSKNSEVQPMAHDVYYEWKTVEDKYYLHQKVPVMIIKNNAGSSVYANIEMAFQGSYYWGPMVTVAFGDQISEKLSFDPSSITLKALGRSTTKKYKASWTATVYPHSSKYIWIKGTVHYIYQKEYYCSLYCEPTGNERYFVKIDEFDTDYYNGIYHIDSGESYGEPPYSVPSQWIEETDAVYNNKADIEDFYGEIYVGTDGEGFNIGAPLGALVSSLAPETAPAWLNVLVAGFSLEDYVNYAVLGHVQSTNGAYLHFKGVKSKYTMRIPIAHHWYGDTYGDTPVPVGFYIKVS
ncbi:hypothetical protein ADU37_CDS11340 [Thermococcus sp. 2319x1]|uniref:hypothetical protein n=1 Tax=Thermococcus sp. 2319x1 TaxID=1674923 RepID=UPI00073AD0DD|nr:hypothetical protein [Thermococcus sp. 2319x1]ALV62833.1 hypothetical protein ADU37_CDS11340 [Thermococcus sp. 2319x1]